MRKKKWTVRELTENPLILRDPAEYAGCIQELLIDGGKIHMELGCGKGRFITQTALLHPDIRYVAVEREPTVLAAAARLAQEMKSPIVFMMMDATELETHFKPGDISRLYINFCDPWPNKKKWAKRRLTHGNFLSLYERLLIPEIFFKTDNRPLFEFSIESFSARGWRMRNVSLDLHRSGMEENIMTEYEEKFSTAGFPIYRLEAYAENIPNASRI